MRCYWNEKEKKKKTVAPSLPPFLPTGGPPVHLAHEAMHRLWPGQGQGGKQHLKREGGMEGGRKGERRRKKPGRKMKGSRGQGGREGRREGGREGGHVPGTLLARP